MRSIELGSGRVALEFADVAAHIQPETVHIRSLSGEDALAVLEQNYQYDLLSPDKLLEKYVGREVTIYPRNADGEEGDPVLAQVLAVNGGAVLRIGDEITFGYPGRFAFPEVPENLISRPTLVWLLRSGAARQRVEASYLTGELNWKADYVLVLNADDTAGDLTGWVTLTNQSGTAYEDAALKLVAGNVRRVAPPRPRAGRAVRLQAITVAPEGFAEESFFEYHLYTLGRPVTLLDREQKQVRLLEAGGFSVEKEYVLSGAPRLYWTAWRDPEGEQVIEVFVAFRNSEENRLGMPLPAGIVRVYKADRSGAQQFVGEDRIDHTPRDERVRVLVGDAFDVVGERRQMDFDVLGECERESEWRIDLRNHKDEDVQVQVVEPAGGDWEIDSASHEFDRVDAHTFRFDVDVPARGETTITYRVRVRRC